MYSNICVIFAGTESETKAFMAVCIETAKRYNLDDYRTPVFIFERLCSIIYPVSGSSVCFCETLMCEYSLFLRVLLMLPLSLSLSGGE